MRKNLALNSSFRSGLDYYSSLNGAILEVAPGFAFYGDDALKIVKSDRNNSGVQSAPIQITAGLPYALSAYVAVPVTVPAAEEANLVARVTWLNILNEPLSDSITSVATVEGTNTWTRLSGVFVAPAGAVFARVSVVQLVAGSAGEVFYVDAILFEQSNYVGGYLDNRDLGNEIAVLNRALTPYQTHVLQGMQLNADISLGNLVFNTIDENDVLWVCTDIQGWWGNADPEIPDIPRGTEDGSYEVTGRYTARQITLSGVFIPPHPDALSAARDRLVSAVNLVRRGDWLRTNEEPTRAGYVRLSGRPQMVTTNARGRTEFQIGLRAADPIKYHWNDADNDGLTTVEIPGSDSTGVVTNIGTADVTAVFEVTGPTGSNSTIHNNLTGETITILPALRGENDVATVTRRELFDNVATLTTSAAHKMVIGDEIVVSGVGAPFDAVNETFIVTAASSTYPYTVSYERVGDDIEAANSSGSISLAHRDVLEIDTYEKSARFNSSTQGQRSKLETLVDWIKLAPGDNTISFEDHIDVLHVITKSINNGVATLTTNAAHHLIAGEDVSVEFTETIPLARKSRTANVVTMTTSTDHGFSVGDNIDVISTENYAIVTKSLVSNSVILTVQPPSGATFAFAAGDQVVVTLPVTRNISEKSRTSSTVTLRTAVAHGYSAGDLVTVSLPTTATISRKALANNTATITTKAAHNYSTGDMVTVDMPTATTVTSKYISGTTPGSQVILGTLAEHYFSEGDIVQVSLPPAATPTGTRSYAGAAGDYRVTINTTAAHGFSPGDRITVYLGSGVSDPLATSYNGSKVVETVPNSTSFTFTMYGPDAAASSASWGTGASITNDTNTLINGARTVTVASPTQLAYII